MPYPRVVQHEEVEPRARLRRQLALELHATRGRSMWREPRSSRRPLRLRALLSRA
jgi:hypothetical protein